MGAPLHSLPDAERAAADAFARWRDLRAARRAAHAALCAAGDAQADLAHRLANGDLDAAKKAPAAARSLQDATATLAALETALAAAAGVLVEMETLVAGLAAAPRQAALAASEGAIRAAEAEVEAARTRLANLRGDGQAVEELRLRCAAPAWIEVPDYAPATAARIREREAFMREDHEAGLDPLTPPVPRLPPGALPPLPGVRSVGAAA